MSYRKIIKGRRSKTAYLKQLDRYILQQLIGPFIFFMVVFVGLLWLNQALSKIDIVIENGQPAKIFVELSMYLLPKVLEIAIPISGFAAAVMVTNRLFGESELVVMMNAGRSVVQLAIPYFIFGLLCFAAMSTVVHILKPWAETKLLDRQEEIGRQYVTQIVKQGEFVSNDDRYTFFFGEKGQNGDLTDILISERVDENLTITHVAQRGQAIVQGADTKLVLLNGSIQEYRASENTLSVVQFTSLSFDLAQFSSQLQERVKQLKEASTVTLAYDIAADPTASAETNNLRSIFHSRFVKPLLALFAPVLGMSVLLVGGFSRSGFLHRIVIAVILMFMIDTFRGIAQSWLVNSNAPWPVLYLPVLAIGVLILVALKLGSTDLTSLRRRIFRKQVA